MAEEGARGIAREIEINGDDASLPEISARSQDCRRRCRRRRRRQRRRQRGYKYQPLWPLLGSFFLVAIPLFSPSLSRAGKIDRGRERELFSSRSRLPILFRLTRCSSSSFPVFVTPASLLGRSLARMYEHLSSAALGFPLFSSLVSLSLSLLRPPYLRMAHARMPLLYNMYLK